MRIVILHPTIPEDATLEDQDSLVQAEAISQSLVRLGHEPVGMGCTLDLTALRAGLVCGEPDAVFNLVESVEGCDGLQYVPPALLDAMNIPYTGAPTEAIFQTTHKLLAKHLLHLAGLPTPTWMTWAADRSGDAEFAWEGPSIPPSTPCIIKAVWEHASRGLDDHSLVMADDLDRLRDRLRDESLRSGRPHFAEQFIEGREFNLSLLGGREGVDVLPSPRSTSPRFRPASLRIVGHRAKWESESFEFQNTPRRFDFPPEDAKLLEPLRDLAKACWKLFGLRGYAVDFRVDVHGWPWILEVNTNPCLAPDAGFAAAAQQAGLSLDEVVGRILDQLILPSPVGQAPRA